MVQPTHTPTMLQAALVAFLEGPATARAARDARSTIEALSAERVPALLRQTRGLAAWWTSGVRYGSVAEASAVVAAALASADPRDRPGVLYAYLAHRSGFLREAAVRALRALRADRAAAALAFAADDPVPEVRTAAWLAGLGRKPDRAR